MPWSILSLKFHYNIDLQLTTKLSRPFQFKNTIWWGVVFPQPLTTPPMSVGFTERTPSMIVSKSFFYKSFTFPYNYF